MSQRHSTRELFAGYPAWHIAEVCCVHIQTARHWHSGIRKPEPTALRLWELHRSGRILTDEWRGWGVRRGKLCTPEHKEISQEQLAAWPFVWALAAEYGKLNPGAGEMFSRIVARLEGPPKKKRGRQGPRATGRDLLPRVTPNPSTLPTMILPRTTRKHA